MDRIHVDGFRFALSGPGEAIVVLGERELVIVPPGVEPIVHALPFEQPDDAEVRGQQILLSTGEARWIAKLDGELRFKETTLAGTPDAGMMTFFQSVPNDEASVTEILCSRSKGATYPLGGLEGFDTEFAMVHTFSALDLPLLACGSPPGDVAVYRVERSPQGRYVVGRELPGLRGLSFLGVVSGYAVGASGFGERVVLVSLADETVHELDTSWLADAGDSIDVFDPACGVHTSTNGIVPLTTESGRIAALDVKHASGPCFLGWREGTLRLVEDEEAAWCTGAEEPRGLIRLDAAHCAVTLKDGVGFAPFAAQ